MKANTGKTKIMCVSDAPSYTADTFIEDEDGIWIGISESMKILGFSLSNQPGVHAHVKSTRRKFRA